MKENHFGKCVKCGYEGTVEANEKGETVCNLCLLSKEGVKVLHLGCERDPEEYGVIANTGGTIINMDN